MSNRVYSLDSDSVDEEVRQAISQGISVKECILCHKKFVPKGRNAWRQNKCRFSCTDRSYYTYVNFPVCTGLDILIDMICIHEPASLILLSGPRKRPH